jgi:hypothetical protein
MKIGSLVFPAALTLMSAASFAVPPNMWYATYSINNYTANGNGGGMWGNLGTCHADADGFNAAVVAHNPPGRAYHYNRRDAAVTAARWNGANAEININDFIFFAGHGWDIGPYFGSNTGYPISSITNIRFGGPGGGFLKWVQAAACDWFMPQAVANTGLNEFARWNASFQGVHSVMAHRAVTYDHAFSNQMSSAFWTRWKTNGETIYSAWVNAQIDWVYTQAGNVGLEPAVMYETGMNNETWASATNAFATVGTKNLTWTTVGNPQY